MCCLTQLAHRFTAQHDGGTRPRPHTIVSHLSHCRRCLVRLGIATTDRIFTEGLLHEDASRHPYMTGDAALDGERP
jgi:hypothetical protein